MDFTIWACVDSDLRGIGQAASRAGWTYWVWENPITRCT